MNIVTDRFTDKYTGDISTRVDLIIYSRKVFNDLTKP